MERVEQHASTAAKVAGVLPVGEQVDVWCRSYRSWVAGFEIAEVTPDGYVIRRLSDGSILPVVFPADEVALASSPTDSARPAPRRR